MESGTANGTGRIRKTPRFTGRASGVTCTRLLGRSIDTKDGYDLLWCPFHWIYVKEYERPVPFYLSLPLDSVALLKITSPAE